MGGAKGAGWITGTPGGRGSEFGGRQVDSGLSFGFRCDKEMKPNPCGFNLNFDEFFGVGTPRRGVAFGVLALAGVNASHWCWVWCASSVGAEYL